jgi:hypothetical protein
LQISVLNLFAFYSKIYIDCSCFTDQVAADNTIPLSPQWLYAKPVDAKSLTTGASGVCDFTCLKLDVLMDWLVFGYLYEMACFLFIYLSCTDI